MIKNILLTIFCTAGLFALADIFLEAEKLSDINYKEILSTVAFIASAIALWLNFSTREASKNQLHHENARKLRERFYSDNMRSFLIAMGRPQREENDRSCTVQEFYDDNNETVRIRCTGSTSLGMASAGLRVNHWNADDAEKYDLESAIVNTINVFEEAVSLLSRNLISRDLIRLSLGKDFSFAYRVIAKMVSRYSQDEMMDFENFEIERLNGEFIKIFGEVEDQNLTIDRRHISEDTEDIPEDVIPINQ